MMLRKIFGSLLVVLFVILAIPNFLIYGLSRTYLDTDFYRSEEVIKGSYDFVVDKTVEVLREDSEMFKGYFQPAELKTKIEQVFTEKIFSAILVNFADQIDQLQQNSDQSMTISLKVLRENLLTVANNLTYQIYQNLPTCSDADLVKAVNSNQAPQCVPKNLPYDQVVKPINDNFEAAIYNQIPEELSNLDSAVPVKVLIDIEKYKQWSFLSLVIVLSLIVLVVYGKTSSIVAYIGNGFFLGGIAGVIFSYALELQISSNVAEQISDPRIVQFLILVLGFLLAEVQKMSLMFVAVGVILWIIRFILKRTVEAKPTTI